MSGRTSWWPCDAAEHERELVVELAEEFGSPAHALTRVLKDLAQAQRNGGRVRTGFRVLAGKCHFAVDLKVNVGAPEARVLARKIVERAGEIGWLDDLEIDTDGRRFTARVSGWEADGARGREAIKKAGQRSEAGPKTRPPEAGHVPPEGDASGSVPPTTTTTDQTGVVVDAPARDRLAAVHPQLAEVLGILEPLQNMLTEPAAVASALNAHPTKDGVAAAHTVASIVQGGQNRTAHTNSILMSVLQRMPDRAKSDEHEQDDAALQRAMKGRL